MSLPLYQVKTISGRGRGLFARSDIPEGTRILAEKPLLTVPHNIPPDEAESYIASKLEGLPNAYQQVFHSLHDCSSDERTLAGTFLSNAIPCGPNPKVDAVYTTVCFINHDCIPNSYPSWNINLNMETVHAIRPIKAGEEITVCYTEGITTRDRKEYLETNFSFECSCSICSLSLPEQTLSDARRTEIERLFRDTLPKDPPSSDLEGVLPKLYQMIRLLEKESEYAYKPQASDAYCNAARMAILYGEKARASVFGRRAYILKVICMGEDREDVQDIKDFMDNPTSHEEFGLLRERNSFGDTVPKDLDKNDFEKWLWLR